MPGSHLSVDLITQIWQTKTFAEKTDQRNEQIYVLCQWSLAHKNYYPQYTSCSRQDLEAPESISSPPANYFEAMTSSSKLTRPAYASVLRGVNEGTPQEPKESRQGLPFELQQTMSEALPMTSEDLVLQSSDQSVEITTQPLSGPARFLA